MSAASPAPTGTPPAEHAAVTPHRIGPNAIIRIAEALNAGPGGADGVFADAGLAHYLAEPPQEMVDEDEVIALQQALRRRLGSDVARAVSFDAGLRTGDYLLAHRIPRPAQRLLRVMPAGPASRMLLKAVGQHAWTFSGSGVFGFTPYSWVQGQPVQVRIANCPICRGSQASQPICDFYSGAFERLFRTLVHRRTQVQEVVCQAQGADACLFEMRW
ncbi:MAG: bacteriochlorophyll 4-vinyl reductase [Thiohalocapsa sp.]